MHYTGASTFGHIWRIPPVLCGPQPSPLLRSLSAFTVARQSGAARHPSTSVHTIGDDRLSGLPALWACLHKEAGPRDMVDGTALCM